MGYTPGDALGGMQADLGAIPLGRVDSAAVAWFLQDLQGWDSAEARASLQQRSADHGAYSAPRYLGERPITLSGTVVAPNAAGLDAAREQLLSAAGLDDTTVVVYEGTPKQALAHRSGKPLWAYITDSIATWSVLLTADDPRRYGVDLQTGSTGLPSTSGGLTVPYTLPYTLSGSSTSGTVTATNAGTFESRPLLIIDGPVSQPQILAQMPDGSVRPLTYSQDLGLGDRLVIDTDAKDVTLNDVVSRRRFLAVPLGWPAIPAGGVVAFTFAAAAYDPAALLTAQWRAAWI